MWKEEAIDDLEGTRKGRRQSDEHRTCFKGNAGRLSDFSLIVSPTSEDFKTQKEKKGKKKKKKGGFPRKFTRFVLY